MPSPMETLFRVHASPVPTQTILGFEESIVTAPNDCTSCRSNTGLKVVPPLTDFHTPPLAEPTNNVRRPFSFTASRAAIRPLMVAEPMLRAANPEMVAESNLTACCAIAVGRKIRLRINAPHELGKPTKLRTRIIIVAVLLEI